MAFYKRKHDAVQAHQITPENAHIVAEWCDGVLVEEINALDPDKKTPGINVPTFEGMQRASNGDYVVKNSDNTFSRWSKDRFEFMYEMIQI